MLFSLVFSSSSESRRLGAKFRHCFWGVGLNFWVRSDVFWSNCAFALASFEKVASYFPSFIIFRYTFAVLAASNRKTFRKLLQSDAFFPVLYCRTIPELLCPKLISSPLHVLHGFLLGLLGMMWSSPQQTGNLDKGHEPEITTRLQ